jgi:hypothetical protein
VILIMELERLIKDLMAVMVEVPIRQTGGGGGGAGSAGSRPLTSGNNGASGRW